MYIGLCMSVKFLFVKLFGFRSLLDQIASHTLINLSTWNKLNVITWVFFICKMGYYLPILLFSTVLEALKWRNMHNQYCEAKYDIRHYCSYIWCPLALSPNIQNYYYLICHPGVPQPRPLLGNGSDWFPNTVRSWQSLPSLFLVSIVTLSGELTCQIPSWQQGFVSFCLIWIF